MFDPYVYFKTRKLSNGLTVYAANWPRCSGVRFHIIIRAGGMQDAPGKEGEAHLLEHLLSYDGSEEGWRNSKVFEDLGGSINLSTTPFFTQIEFTAPADKKFLQKALNSISSHILNPLFTASDFEKEKAIVGREFKRRYQTTFSFENESAIKRVLYSGTGFKRLILPTEGSADTIGNISYDDIQSFHRKYYVGCPANISVVAVGALSVDEIFGLVHCCPLAFEESERFSSLPTKAEMPKFSCDRLEFDLSKYMKKEDGGVDFYYIEFSALLASFGADQKNNIFRSMFLTKLNEEVRHKRHWSYGPSSYLNRLGPFDILKVSFKDIEKQNAVQMEELFKITLSAVMKDEKMLDRKKKSKLSGLALLDYSYIKLADEAAYSIGYDGRLESLIVLRDRLEAVNIVDIKEICQHILDGHSLISVIR
jgi:predicted Zn-dependent peptidase